MALNINDMAASAYNIITQIQNATTETVGLDCLWCRATPEPNSEDVILQEYTLTNVGVDCPKPMKVVTSNSEYNAGNFTADLFGINYEAPLEVNVPIATWQQIYPKDTQPQAGDVVYIQMLHRLYECKSSQVMYTIASMPTYFKCQLAKYNPTASRRETEEFRSSVEDFTVTQEQLFGDAISQEVADTVVEAETAYNTTTSVDPFKDFDANSIVIKRLTGASGNRIANAYYDFRKASMPVSYRASAVFGEEAARTHWIFSCWFRVPDGTEELEDSDSTGIIDNPVQKQSQISKFELYVKDKQYWWFTISTPLLLEEGDTVTISRGSLIQAQAEVARIPSECSGLLSVRIKVSEMQRLNKKLSSWYTSSALKIQKSQELVFLRSSGEGRHDLLIKFTPTENRLTINFGEISKTVSPKKKIVPAEWNYIMADMCQDSLRIVVEQRTVDENEHISSENRLNQQYKVIKQAGNFSVSGFECGSAGSNLQICNIRLYENEYPMEEKWTLDMYSQVTRNASKLIVVDDPNPQNAGNFVTPVR